VRYYFLRAIPFGQDGDYQHEGFVARYNADLANDFGNLVQRATRLASRDPAPLDAPRAPLGPAELELREHATTLRERVAAAFEGLALHEAVAAVGTFVGQANRYLEITAPWLLAKQGSTDRLELVLDHAVEAARLAAWYYAPIIPRAASEAHVRLTGTIPCERTGVFNPARRGTVRFGPPLFPRRE
jgi:methionyl-tRNA synthetase